MDPADGVVRHRRRLGRAASALAAAVVLGAGCRTAAPPAPAHEPAALAEGRASLTRPLPGDMAALYRLRVPRAGTLRLSVVSRGGSVRMSVSEPFGSTLLIAASRPDGATTLLDLRAGCRLEGTDPATGIGLTGLPLDRAVRLLGGRLPAVGSDVIRPDGAGGLAISGDGWRAVVRLAVDPWRVVEVSDGRASVGDPTWTVRVREHILSVPERLRIDRADGEWAELDLVGLEWNQETDLPALLDLPRCGP